MHFAAKQWQKQVGIYRIQYYQGSYITQKAEAEISEGTGMKEESVGSAIVGNR